MLNDSFEGSFVDLLYNYKLQIAFFVLFVMVAAYLFLVVAPYSRQEYDSMTDKCNKACQPNHYSSCEKDHVICYLPGQYIEFKKDK